MIVVSLDRIICCSLFGCTPGSQPSWLIHPTSLCCRCTLSAMDFLLISMAHHMCCICCWMDVTCVAPAVGDTDGFQEHLSTSENVIHWSILLSGHSATLCRVHSTLGCFLTAQVRQPNHTRAKFCKGQVFKCSTSQLLTSSPGSSAVGFHFNWDFVVLVLQRTCCRGVVLQAVRCHGGPLSWRVC